MAAISENTRLSRSHVSMITVCYTQVGELQIFTLEVGNSCVCVHFPQPASRISSRCQLHFPVANCILRFTPSPIFFVPQPPNLAPKPFLLSEQTALSFGKERTRTFLSRSTVQGGAGGKLLPSYLRTNHPSRSTSAPPVLLQLFLFMPN